MKFLKSDEKIHKNLLDKADSLCAELLEHPVLSMYRDKIAIILKGSTAHGYSDCYSDVDFVVFCPRSEKQKIVDEYIKQGLSTRTDGVFLPLDNWVGHYNIDAYEDIVDKYDQQKIEYLWEYGGSKILYDHSGMFADVIKEVMLRFEQDLPMLTKAKYIDCQLYLDWLRQPLRRADEGATLLYTANVYACVNQLLFLLCEVPYPCDKWLPYNFAQLAICDSLKEKVESLPGLLAELHKDFKPGLELVEYPIYKQGADIINDIKEMLKDKYGNQQWIDEWYLYA